ncbi:hypothetical protein HDU97_006168 [Phlyctochytrium planicorne]|nr:hypothetical protein HDU97_006168 [Phlyctochytrium planicorne]
MPSQTDYCWLEDVHRLADNMTRDQHKTSLPPAKKLSVKQQLLLRNCISRKIKLKFLSMGMTKHKTNNSIFLKKVPEDLKISEAMDLILKADHMQNPDSRNIVKSYLDNGLDKLFAYLQTEKSEERQYPFVRLDPDKSLKAQLEGITIFEYPSIIVCRAQKENEDWSEQKE